MTQSTARAARAHRTAVEMSIADVTKYLVDVLGQKLVGYIAGVENHKAVGPWSEGTRVPRPAAQDKLRAALRIFQQLQDAESPHTVRAWFVGLNPQLDEESPATAIREGRIRDAIVAANAFLSGG